MRTLSLFTIVFGLLDFGGSSRAAPITYILSGATFNDGGVATGSFIVNDRSFSAININVSGGSTAGLSSPAHFTSVNPSYVNFPGATFFVTSATDLTSTPILSFSLPPDFPVNNFAINGFEDTCLTTACDAFSTPSRTFTAGSVNAAPEPASVLLLVVGIGLLATWRWRSIRRKHWYISRSASSQTIV